MRWSFARPIDAGGLAAASSSGPGGRSDNEDGMRVLVVEDEARIADDIRAALEAAGFAAEIAADGEDGWYRADSEDFQVVVLDLGLPRLDGLTALRRWRADGRTMPVIVLTARDGWREKVEVINAGADDYLTKPFHVEELVARVRALARRAAGQAGPIVKVAGLEIDTRSRTVSIEGRPVALTAFEYRLLNHLASHAGRIVSQAELTLAIHGQDKEHDSNALEVMVARLRKKIGGVIQTRRGHGYVIDTAVGSGR